MNRTGLGIKAGRNSSILECIWNINASILLTEEGQCIFLRTVLGCRKIRFCTHINDFHATGFCRNRTNSKILCFGFTTIFWQKAGSATDCGTGDSIHLWKVFDFLTFQFYNLLHDLRPHTFMQGTASLWQRCINIISKPDRSCIVRSGSTEPQVIILGRCTGLT